MSIHPAAIVDASAEIDSTAEIGPYAIIEAGARVGPRTRVMAHAVIGRLTTLGEDNVVHYGAIVGHDPQHLGHKGEQTFLIVGDRNVIREYATIHRGHAEENGKTTRIGNDCYLMGYAHVAHDCQLGDKVILVNYAALSGHVVVEDNAFIGGHAGAHQFVRIGRYAMLGGAAVARKDCPPYMMLYGDNTVIKLNFVALRRAGMGRETVQAIGEAFDALYRRGLSVTSALETIQARGSLIPEVDHLVKFIQGSKRGIAKGLRGGATEYDE